MIDAALRRVIDRPLDRAGGFLSRCGVSANAMTVAGFAVGMQALPALAVQAYGAALALILLNRLSDGLDGAIARRRGATDFGGYLDIVLDFIFYAGIALGFALANPAANALAACFLIFSFMGTGSSFLAYAVMAAKRGRTSTERGPKSLYYLGGLTEGAETIALFVAICLWPGWFPVLAYGFGALCWLTTATRILAARRDFTP
ncbi:MAG: CDP-alcohol phosphatidyltransferase family protein [Oceanibaculum nanhaiense]|uniref:CDP-alcohol phosphatidyltransferase family protein n=1 Tax=Oceanibaculum nanhaiense TaxID=1909734 RepID=UPI0025A3F019|nr:CDP-alcohol phosphatidyltransferase family protein [Oceanibaculum nanhaiense]MDM7946181.1 CDP-alcohol phosphatidyltransferase family protein [Oceanibaculum nanhaiense]